MRDEDDLSVEVRVDNCRVEAYLQPRADGAYKLFVVVLSMRAIREQSGSSWVSYLQTKLGTAVPRPIPEAHEREGARIVIEPISKTEAFRALSLVSDRIRVLGSAS